VELTSSQRRPQGLQRIESELRSHSVRLQKCRSPERKEKAPAPATGSAEKRARIGVPSQMERGEAQLPRNSSPSRIGIAEGDVHADGVGGSPLDLPCGESAPVQDVSSDSWYTAPIRTRRRAPRKPGRGRKKQPRSRGIPCRECPPVPTAGMHCPRECEHGDGRGPRQEDAAETLQRKFAPVTWKKNTHSYASPPLPFTGPEPRCTHPYGRLPSVLGLFDKFWSQKMQRRIVRESNQYASEVIDEKLGTTRRGLDWRPLQLEEFRAYISICLLMGLKRLLSHRLYWTRDQLLFNCPIISRLMIRDRYEFITRCLHVENAPPDVCDRSSPNYDKLHKVRWMLDEVQERFKVIWSPNQQLTVDEGMVMYKGIYCPIRQYMPKKPIRLGIKVWAAADALSKYLWDFEVYCGKTDNPHDEDGTPIPSETEDGGRMDEVALPKGPGEGSTGRNIVKELLKDLGGRGHIVTTDNFFTSVPLFLDLLENGTMATGTLRSTRKYVPRGMFAKTITKKQEIGWVDYRMHEEGKIYCAVWKDKQPVILLSTHAEPIKPHGPRLFVWRKFGGRKKKVHTGPMHLQYTENMRGIDTADQLQGVYSSLTRSHK
jgi:hypothetical protein